ncbi:hypothetical protein ZOSMA_36G00750 [Zostera marina]|uniref:Uncharacterized protein n=1 Tax=Zostera marina TaxID=29655 RepID=A0A0K9P875_ZOSMR|nr:hypothetical protein ZOSMA_36G00750 [Zostera marina]
MFKDWPDLKRNDQFGFWKHEWNHHGTCSPWYNNPKMYFQKTLSLKRHFNIFNVLKDKGISPSRNFILKDRFISAISTFPGSTILICQKRRNENNVFEDYISEIRICLNMNLHPTVCIKKQMWEQFQI